MIPPGMKHREMKTWARLKQKVDVSFPKWLNHLLSNLEKGKIQSFFVPLSTLPPTQMQSDIREHLSVAKINSEAGKD